MKMLSRARTDVMEFIKRENFRMTGVNRNSRGNNPIPRAAAGCASLSQQRFDIHCRICERFYLRRKPPADHHLGVADLLRNRGEAAKTACSDKASVAGKIENEQTIRAEVSDYRDVLLSIETSNLKRLIVLIGPKPR